LLIEENHLHNEEAVASTIKVMQNSAVKAIKEAAFLYNAVRIRVDKHLTLTGTIWA
jgi:propanediol utilization protein